eukprot:CAMPEP_0183314972 /NCGR_PEP_ID=MMETSP0160_2-20130417/50250_1 /TAXON_ID=2839 ORGANISM="Odontella Sinensis, Strain Grunow 1884" /NCGR_SAMPLE_ID=MMETSP0160_2 /ASSEMBLY_ACC=CAM_ASM_000250 /LENGTH=226 /DNA_ID=CAMNT_0025480423 /DNA_START=93 /DNA_END=773 /DNA_ORIENTATION=+
MSKVALVLGVGPGIGGAVAKLFASKGYAVACVSRGLEKAQKVATECPGGLARGYSGDVADPSSMEILVNKVKTEMGSIDFLCYNAGSGVFKTWEDISLEEFNQSININATGLLTTAKLVCPDMVERGHGTVAITGATASLRGKPFTAGFAAAKGAQRMLAQSLARDLGPKGIHVFLAIIDGVVGQPGGSDAKLDPNAIARTYFDLASQPKSAWTHEIDLRPYAETW